MTEQRTFSGAARLLQAAAALVIVIWGINQARAALVSTLAAVFLAALCVPLVQLLERKRVPAVAAVLLVLAGLVALLLAGGGLVGSSLGGFSASLPAYQPRIQEEVSAIQALLAKNGIHVAGSALLEYLDPSAVMKLAAGLLGGLGAALSNIVLVLLTVMFILLEASSFPVKLRAVLGDSGRAFPEFTQFILDIRRYVLVKTGLSLGAGILIWLWLTLLGVASPALWAVLAFLLLYIPHVGSILAGIPAVCLTLVQFGAGRAALVGAGYVAVNFILGNVVEPKLMGYKFNLSALVVFLSLIFWGRLLGLLGAVLCVPLTMTVKFACEKHESTRWIAVLLGPGEATGDAVQDAQKFKEGRENVAEGEAVST